MVREHSNSISSNGYPPPPNTNTGPPLQQQHPYYAYGGSAPGGPSGYPEGPFSGPKNPSAGDPKNPVNHHHPSPYAPQGPPPPPPPGRPPYGARNQPPHKPPPKKTQPASARPYPPVPDGPPSSATNPAGQPPSWQSMHLPPDPNGNNGNNGRMPYGSWNADQAAGHHAAAHHHAAAAAAAAAGYYPHYGGPPNGSPQRGPPPPPPPHFWRPVSGPPPSGPPSSNSSSQQHPPPNGAPRDHARPGARDGPLPVTSGSASSPTGPKNNSKMSKAAINKHNNNTNNLQQQQQSPPGVNKTTGNSANSNKNKISSLHNAPGSNGTSPADIAARLGATSPTQIETTHRDEVQIMGCTCKKTRCLKLYCQCFGVKLHCGPACRCLNCFNTRKHEKQRKEAMRQILARNPGAFDTKFQKNAKATTAVTAKILAHKLGCKCRKSACMKKYCECYAGSVKCSPSCRCVGCKNLGPFGVATGGPSGDGAAVPIRRPVAKPARRKKSEPFQAAQNLTFLKHGSPDSAKAGLIKAPDGAPRSSAANLAAAAAVHEVASMPSLASSSEGTSPGDFARGRSKDEDEDEHDSKHASKLNGLMRSRTKPILDEQDDDVKTLLMAAYAMAEIGKGSSPAKRGFSPGMADSTMKMAKTAASSQPHSSPPFRDAKRPRSDLEGADSAAMANSRSLDSKRMHFE